MAASTDTHKGSIEGSGKAGHWVLTITSTENLIAMETAIDALCAPDALSLEAEDCQPAKLQVWFQNAPDISAIHQIAARALQAPQDADICMEFVAEHDYLSENRKSFPPLKIGRFWIYGSHITQTPPKTLQPILIDAAQAFGSGTHPTTHGCLLALGDIKTLKTRPQNILDMGCGSAILAIAASHLFPNACVMAADNDPISVRTAAENRQLNNVSRRQMKTVHSAGFSNRALSRIGSYDVILANILARPLRQMAQDLTAHLSPRGQLILSGLLTSQVNWVMQAYLPRGMRLKKHIIIGEWSCLVLVHRRVRSALKHKDTYTRKAGI